RTAHEELRQLMRQRAEIMKRIGTVKQTIVGLANLFGDDVLNEELLELVDRKSGVRQPGFTKACRMVLMESAKPLGAREVCDQIRQQSQLQLANRPFCLASASYGLQCRSPNFLQNLRKGLSRHKSRGEWVPVPQ